MKVLFLYSDWKWTGPAEPVLQMCQGLQARGHDVLLAHMADAAVYKESVSQKAVEYGLHTTTRFRLDRHLPPVGTARDLFALPRFLARGRFDILHVHLTHDHALGGLCARLVPRRRRPLVVRTLHRRDVLRPTLGNRLLLRRLSDGCLTFTESFRQRTLERFRLDPGQVGLQPMTVDIERFSPERRFADVRPTYGIPADAPLIGIVGRWQKYRKAEVFLDAAARVIEAEPATRFMIIGRSSQMQESVVQPMRALGLQEHVILPGYLIESYADALNGLDIFTLLMPGFDGTARAVREAMALAKPCVVADFGMLPEIVPDGVAGLVVPTDPQALAAAWLALIRDPERRRRFGQGARAHACEHFAPHRVAPALEAFYQSLLAERRPPRPG
ncbi:MAG: D-inositol 3-phosphate glycosyltransferase [Lentisphaerae bacterium ADurb.BinA184]|nr:MAG: D-inositol 3-phosphate glycosyltransferase [Lentisphaerae bacterium ADurb.BinA184]